MNGRDLPGDGHVSRQVAASADALDGARGATRTMDSEFRETMTVSQTETAVDDGIAPTDTTFGRLVTVEPKQPRPRHRIDGLIVWMIVSLAFLGYLAFGSLSVQVWRFSDFLQQYYPVHVSRRILHIWIYQGNQLPDVHFAWLVHVAFYACLFVCIACAIYGAWLLLDRAGTGASRAPADRQPPVIEG